MEEKKPDIRDLVVDDLEIRFQKGLEDYGVPLRPFNGRSPLLDLYEELLDSVLYLRQLIYEEEHGA